MHCGTQCFKHLRVKPIRVIALFNTEDVEVSTGSVIGWHVLMNSGGSFAFETNPSWGVLESTIQNQSWPSYFNEARMTTRHVIYSRKYA